MQHPMISASKARFRRIRSAPFARDLRTARPFLLLLVAAGLMAFILVETRGLVVSWHGTVEVPQ